LPEGISVASDQWSYLKDNFFHVLDRFITDIDCSMVALFCA
jgi:hypothetical protein